MVVHHDDLLQQVFGGAADDAVQGSFDDGQGLVQVDQHHCQAGQVLWVVLLQTPVQKRKEVRAVSLPPLRSVKKFSFMGGKSSIQGSCDPLELVKKGVPRVSGVWQGSI